MFVAKNVGTVPARRRRPWRPVLEDLEGRIVPAALSIVPGGDGSSILLYPNYQIASGPGGPLTVTIAARQARILQSSIVNPSYGLEPQQVRAAYGIDQIAFGSISGDGSGQTIAIVDAYDDPALVPSTDPSFGTSDLAMFDKQFGLPDPPSFQKLNELGGTSLPGTDPKNSWEMEEALDVEWAHAIAPRASIILIECNSPSIGDLLNAGARTAASLPGVSVVSMSFGTSEFGSETVYDANLATPAGHQGVTFVASTGDSGAPGEYPAYSPSVVAVGGTSLTLNADNSYNAEVGWSGSGGGTSAYESEPTFQQGVQTTGKRTIPDVAFDADPATGVDVYDSFGRSSPWVPLGGTSLAAPCWAAMIAIANQGRVAAGGTTLDGPSQALPALYALPTGDFHDITSGSSGFQATQGYDEVTGLGSPASNLLAPDLASYQMSANLVVTAQPPVNVTAGIPFALAVAVEDQVGNALTSFNGNVTVALQSGPAGSILSGPTSVAAIDGEASFRGLTLDRAGTGYTIELSSGSLSPTSVRLSVSPAAAAQLAVTAEPPASLQAGEAFGMTVTAYDAFGNVATDFAGNVNVGVAGGPPGASLSGSTSVVAGNGVATFTGLTLTKAGDYAFQSTSTALASVTTTAVIVSPAAASQLVVTSQPPAGVTAGSWFGLTVAAQDRFGNGVPGWSGIVTVALATNPAGGTLSGIVSVAADQGVASFSGLSINTAGGGYSLWVNSNGLTPAMTTAFSVVPGAASRMVITYQPPAPLIVGAGFQLAVTVEDRVGNLASTFNGRVTVALARHAGKGRLLGTITTTAINGLATFPNLRVTAAGQDYRLIIAGSGLPETVTSPFNVAFASRNLTRVSLAHRLPARRYVSPQARR